jgi:UDP-N-acetylmuramate dehydrogenase
MATDAVDAAAATLGARGERDVPLGPMTTYRVGGAASLFFTVESTDDLALAARAVGESGVEVLVVGKGSNVLVSDAGFRGLALTLGESFATITIDGTVVVAGAAAALPVVARRSAAAGLTGFEWAVGVPGSIGGAARMNAGGHGSDMAACLSGVRVFDLHTGDHEYVRADDLDLAYRHSALKSHHVVTEATLALAAGDVTRAEAEIAEIVKWRRDNQPGGQNAGSVFTNPTGDSAGRLIDAAGLKGLAIGSASVSPKHANFFIAANGGRADDVYALMVEVRRRVADASGVVLAPETRLVGFAPLPEVQA